MATIGSVDVDIMRGYPQLIRPRVETWVVPGLDGYGAQTLGQGDSEFNVVTVKYVDTSDEANTFLTSCLALQGTVVEISDDWGDTYDNILVVGVDVSNSKRPVIYQGNPAVRVEVNWKMIQTAENFV